MAPRVTILILVGIVIYVSLSLYHWRQVQKIPGNDNKKGVHGVLARDSHEKNWVQVTTASNQQNKTVEDATQAEAQKQSQTAESQPLQQETNSLSADPDHTTQEPEPPVSNELQDALQQEKDRNRQQADRIKELFTQVLSLQTALDDASALIKETTEPGSQSASTVKNGDESDQLGSLKKSLLAKMDALAKANTRISGLADRLDQARLDVAQLESSNRHLQITLTDTETDKIKEQRRAEKYFAELNRTRDEKEKYLAETGRLHSELQQVRTRLAYTENELNKAESKASAMLRFGQQQDELITPFRQQIEILNARNADTNKKLIEAEDLAQQLGEHQENLQQEVAKLRLEKQENNATIKELKERAQLLAREEEHSAELTIQLKVLADQLNGRDQQIKTVQAELAELQTIFDKADQQSTLLQKEKDEQQQALAQVTKNLQETIGQLETAKSRQIEMQTELDNVRTANTQLVNQAAADSKMLKKIKTESAQLAARLEQAEKQQAIIPKTASSAETQPQQTKTALENQQKLARAEKTIKQLELALQQAGTRLAKSAQEAEQLRKSLATAEQKQADTTLTKNLQEEISQLTKTLGEKSQQQDDLHLQVTNLTAQNQALQEKISESSKDNLNKIEELETLLSQKTKELDKVQNSHGKIEQETTELRAELEQRETAFFAMQEKNSELQNRYDALQKERDTLLTYSVDSDNDTVSDAKDNCPNTVAGADVGPNGCEKDIDGDSIVDRLDLCPDTTPQTAINSLGCATRAPIVLSGLYFSGGNSELSPASKSYLDKVVAALQSVETVRFEVGGHTDSIGDVERNQQVSQLRAEAVSNYLVSKGFAEERLESVGYGSAQPIGDNNTTEGRAANRRVELNIISLDDEASSSQKILPATTAEEAGLPAQ